MYGHKDKLTDTENSHNKSQASCCLYEGLPPLTLTLPLQQCKKFVVFFSPLNTEIPEKTPYY